MKRCGDGVRLWRNDGGIICYNKKRSRGVVMLDDMA